MDVDSVPRVVIVDDDADFLLALESVFAADGFETRAFSNAPDALAHLRRTRVDLVVLDVRMPRMDGVEALAALRRFSDAPALMLTAHGDDIDEASALRIGADDYVRKPCPARVITARGRAAMRRAQSRMSGQGAQSGGLADAITHGALRLDPARHLATWRGAAVRLTAGEFALAYALARRAGRVFSREALRAISSPGPGAGRDDADPRAVDSCLKRIRAKFRAVDADFRAIETLYGVGYRWRA